MWGPTLTSLAVQGRWALVMIEIPFWSKLVKVVDRIENI